MTIHEQIAQARIKHNITMERLQELTNINSSNLSKILRGKINATEPTLITLANALGYELKLVKKSDDEK